MPICDECSEDVKKVHKPIRDLSLCDSCMKEWNEEHKLTRVAKPSTPDQNKPFTDLQSVSQIIQGAKSRKDDDVISYLGKLPLEDLQEEISYAIAVLQAASSIYGQKCITESLKRKNELQEQFIIIKRKWRDQQAQKEREKRIKALKGPDRKLYEMTGSFLDEMLKEFKQRMEGK